MKDLKIGEKVKMVNCGEADFYPDRIWICRSDSFKEKYGDNKEVVFLEGFAGYFLCSYLERVEI